MDFFTGLSVQGYVALQKNYALRPTDLYYPNLYLCGNCSELFVPTAYFEEENIQFQLLLNSMYTLQFIMRFSQYSTQVTSCVLAAMMFMSGECGRVCLGFFFFAWWRSSSSATLVSPFSSSLVVACPHIGRLLAAAFLFYKRRQGHSDWGIYDPLEVMCQ